MERLKDTIEVVVRELSAKKAENKELSPEVWLKKTLTKKELGHIKFHYFRKGILGVHVDSSAWKYNFSLKRDEMLSRLKKYAPGVKEVRFSVGDVG